jgi:hypothetical protein
MRPLCCRFAVVLPILTFCSVLAHAQGTTPSTTNLLGISPGPEITFGVSVRAGTSVRPPFPRPSGTVTIYNGTAAVGSPATLSPNTGFTSASFAQVFGAPDPSIAASAGGAVWGDFNEDGHADLLVYGPGSGTGGQPGPVVQDFIANSTPSPRLTIPSYKPLAVQQLALPLLTQAGQTLAVLDVDGDGHLDLLAGNTVAYGNGDGTFGRVAVLPALATGYNQTYAVDIDGDGKTDIVAVDTPPAVSAPGTVQYAFTVFHNAAGGSFTAMGPYPLAPSFQAGGLCCAIYNIFGLGFADVNGDGHIDVLSQSNAVPVGNAESGDLLNVMLNLGPGFGAPKTIDTSTVPNLEFASTAIADLNNDGKQDLIFSYQSNNRNNGVATLLGHGDGTFAAPVNFNIGGANAIGSAVLPLITEDVDADGNADVVLGSGVLLLGKGDGTLTPGTPLFTSTVAPGNAPPAYALLTAPATASISRGENDPFFALVFVNLQSGANAVFIPNIGSGAEPTVKLAPGTYSLTAHYSGDATYAASVSNTINLTFAPIVPKVTVTSSANPSYTGESVTFIATITGVLSNPLAGSTSTVTFSDGATALGTVPVSAGAASYTTNFSSAGNHTITAAYGGDATDAAASGNISQSVVVSPISFPTPPPGSTTLTVASGSDAGGPFTINAIPGYIGALFLTCSGLPANASCSFTPQNPGIAAPSGSYGIIVATSSSEPVLGKVEDSVTHPGAVEWCGVSLLGLLFMGRIRRSRVGRLCLVLAAGVFVSLTGCGGSGKSTTTGSVTPPGTYTFQLNASTSPTEAGTPSPAVSQTYTLIVQ